MILLTIDSLPVPWKTHGGYGKRSFNRCAKEKGNYQWQIRSQWNREVISTPIQVEYTYHMPIPKGTSKPKTLQMLNGIIHHLVRPDLDNLDKFLSDCLIGTVLQDDSQICKKSSQKIYGLVPKTVIKIYAL